MAELYRFAAFISYSSKDAAFAQRLHKALESYNIPVQLGHFDLIGGGRKNRIFPVFRDREELPSGDLGDAIQAALKASSALIIICSPNAAASPWVNKEIESFLALGRRNRIFAIIHPDAPAIDADSRDATTASFPPAFRGQGLDGALEPIAGDARKGKDGFRNAWLKVVAGLIGVNAGALQDRDRKRRQAQRTRQGLGVSAAVLALALGGAALDALLWRTDLTHRADGLIRDGRRAEAAAVALGGAPALRALLPLSDEGADGLIRSVGASRLIAELGPLRAFDLAADGATLAIQRADSEVTGAVIDFRTGTNGARTELGTLGMLNNLKLAADGANLVIRRDDPQGTGAVIDLKTGAQKELGALGPLFYFAADGTNLVIQRGDAQGSGAVFDLKTGAKTELGPLQFQTVDLANDGSKVAIMRADAEGTGAVIDLKTGAKTELGPLDRFDLSTDGSTVAILRNDSQRTGAVIDLKSGAKTELGALGPLREIRLAADGGLVAIQRSDPEHSDENTEISVAAINFKTGAKTELGPLSHFDLGADGATLAFQRADAQETGAFLDLKTGATRELGALGGLRGVRLAADGASIAIERSDDDGTGAVINLKTGAKTELGPLRDFDLSADGGRLVIWRGDAEWGTGAVFNLTRPVEVSSSGTELARAVCDANAHALRPFDGALRDPARFKNEAAPASTAQPVWDEEPSARSVAAPPSDADRKTFSILRGRPWNPCDWRGVAAVFPDPVRGDGWFEGPRQWARLMRVRWLGAKDWDCAETLVGASEKQKADRAEMCRLYGPKAATNPTD